MEALFVSVTEYAQEDLSQCCRCGDFTSTIPKCQCQHLKNLALQQTKVSTDGIVTALENGPSLEELHSPLLGIALHLLVLRHEDENESNSNPMNLKTLNLKVLYVYLYDSHYKNLKQALFGDNIESNNQIYDYVTNAIKLCPNISKVLIAETITGLVASILSMLIYFACF
mgnify:CR=1 FL=1